MAKTKGRFRRVETGIYERNGLYYAPVWDPKTGKKDWNMALNGLAPPFGTINEARSYRGQVAEVKSRRKLGGPNETCDEFAQRWTRDYTEGRSEGTIKHYEQVAGMFGRDFEGVPLRHVTRPLARLWACGGVVPVGLHDYAEKWERAERDDNGDLTVKGVGQQFSPIRTMFQDALQDGLVDDNPFVGLRIRQSRGRKDLIVLEPHELRKLAGAARASFEADYAETLVAMIAVAAYTGLRPGELYAVRWGDIDFRRHELHVREQYNSKLGRYTPTKNGQRRTVVLHGEAADALKRIRPDDPGDDLVFKTKRGGRYTGRVHHYYWDKIRTVFWESLPESRKRVIPRDMDFYELRHFCATQLLEAGAAAHEVAVQLGHNDNGALVMSTYGHPSEKLALKRVLQIMKGMGRIGDTWLNQAQNDGPGDRQGYRFAATAQPVPAIQPSDDQSNPAERTRPAA